MYSLTKLDADVLQVECEKRLYLDYLTVNGSGSFHVMVFKPKGTTFHASSQLSVCDNCLDLNFEACPSFRIYEPQVAKLNEKATRSKAASMVEENTQSCLSDMVTKGSIFSVRADNIVNNYFLLICESEVVEHLDAEKPHADDAGQVIHYGTRYVTEKHLEVSIFTDKYHEFKVQHSRKLLL